MTWERLGQVCDPRMLLLETEFGVTGAEPGLKHDEVAAGLWGKDDKRTETDGMADEDGIGSGIEDMLEDEEKRQYSPEWGLFVGGSENAGVRTGTMGGDVICIDSGAHDTDYLMHVPAELSSQVITLYHRAAEAKDDTGSLSPSPQPAQPFEPGGPKSKGASKVTLKPPPGVGKAGVDNSGWQSIWKCDANEAFGDVELAETERLTAQQQNNFWERMAKIELKKCKMELEHQAKEQDQVREHELCMAMIQHQSHNQSLESTPMSSSNTPGPSDADFRQEPMLPMVGFGMQSSTEPSHPFDGSVLTSGSYTGNQSFMADLHAGIF
ncbi:hypothetical protein K439DRAFT_1616147 [Ramaria rubella]|nr:hypothetical protein K439DRAFT_1616147 [Ramaria rubella]